MISTMQLKRCFHQGCQLLAMSVNYLDLGESQEVSLDDYHLLTDFANVFLSEILGMPPKCDIAFRIDLVPRVDPISRAPYRMTTQELQELHL